MAKRKRQLSKGEQQVIQNGKLVQSTLDSKGWKQLISPMLDEMITSVIGRKHEGKWLQGHMVKSRKDEKKEFYIGYLCALQEFSNSVHNYISSSEAIKKIELDRSETEALPPVIPMVNDLEETEDI